MIVCVTGSEGFIGSNLVSRLKTFGFLEVKCINRRSSNSDLKDAIVSADLIFHLAGVNRSKDNEEFAASNIKFTEKICNLIQSSSKTQSIIYTSSIKVSGNDIYAISKKTAEDLVYSLEKNIHKKVDIYRLPGVFGKGCKPNYNSVVATWCFNSAHNIPCQINDHDREITLLYIDDLIDEFVDKFVLRKKNINGLEQQFYCLTLGDLHSKINEVARKDLFVIKDLADSEFLKKLRSTYLYYLENQDWIMNLKPHRNNTGTFVEALKIDHLGQLSFLTIEPKSQRGDHYHNTKVEKFWLLFGTIDVKLENILNGEIHSSRISADEYSQFEIPPGWRHTIVNIGQEKAILAIWANEIYSEKKPDTYR